jgi:hypothetical protein
VITIQYIYVNQNLIKILKNTKKMKKIILAFFLICTFKANAQKLDVGLSSGTGLLYIFEITILT